VAKLRASLTLPPGHTPVIVNRLKDVSRSRARVSDPKVKNSSWN
jgi:hypothetical protein